MILLDLVNTLKKGSSQTKHGPQPEILLKHLNLRYSTKENKTPKECRLYSVGLFSPSTTDDFCRTFE